MSISSSSVVPITLHWGCTQSPHWSSPSIYLFVRHHWAPESTQSQSQRRNEGEGKATKSIGSEWGRERKWDREVKAAEGQSSSSAARDSGSTAAAFGSKRFHTVHANVHMWLVHSVHWTASPFTSLFYCTCFLALIQKDSENISLPKISRLEESWRADPVLWLNHTHTCHWQKSSGASCSVGQFSAVNKDAVPLLWEH